MKYSNKYRLVEEDRYQRMKGGIEDKPEREPKPEDDGRELILSFFTPRFKSKIEIILNTINKDNNILSWDPKSLTLIAKRKPIIESNIVDLLKRHCFHHNFAVASKPVIGSEAFYQGLKLLHLPSSYLPTPPPTDQGLVELIQTEGQGGNGGKRLFNREKPREFDGVERRGRKKRIYLEKIIKSDRKVNPLKWIRLR
jgi:hypothetical protein